MWSYLILSLGPETVGSVVGEQRTDSLSPWIVGGAGYVSRVFRVSSREIHDQLRKGTEVLESKLGR